MVVRRSFAFVLSVLSLASVLTQSGSRASTGDLKPSTVVATFVPGQALVRFRPGVSAERRAAVHARYGARVLRHLDGLETDLVSLPDGGIDRYARNADVVHAEPNYTGRIQLHPDDPCFEDPCVPGAYAWQWQLAWDNAQFAWDAYPGAFHTAAQRDAMRATSPLKLPKVAVLDTKIDAGHDDWIPAGGRSGDVAAGGMLDLADATDFVPPASQAGNASYHGTFVAGILAAAANNGKDAAGLGTMSQVMPVTVVDGSGTAAAADVAEGMVYAWERGARVINLSLGISADSKTVHDAIKIVTGAVAAPGDVRPPSTGAALVVAAAGNHTGDAAFYPGSYAEVMSVAGTDATDRHALCSNHNANVSVSAPADGVVSLREHGGAMKGLCGTSAAAPQVSAMAALLFSQSTGRTAKQVRDIIEKTADDRGTKGRDQYFGWGRVNAERALRYGSGGTVTQVSSTIPPGSGGTSSITATVTSAAAITQADFLVDDPNCNGKLGMSVSKIATNTYRLTGTLDVTSSTLPGPHALFVRARDANGVWSASSVGTLYVDRARPAIIGAQTSTAAIRATAQPVTIDFTIADDLSDSFIAAYEVRPAAGPSSRAVFTDVVSGLSLGTHRITWLPESDVPAGAYRVRLVVADEGLNASSVTMNLPFVVV